MSKKSISKLPGLPDGIREAINTETLAVFVGAGVSRLIGCKGWDELAKNLVNRCYKEKLIKFIEKEKLCTNTDHKKIITMCYHIFKKPGLIDIFYDEMNYSLNESIVSPIAFEKIESDLSIEAGAIRNLLRKKGVLDKYFQIGEKINLKKIELKNIFDNRFDDYSEDIVEILHKYQERKGEITRNIYDDISKLGGLFITTNADSHFDRLFNTPNIFYYESDFSCDRLNHTNLYHIHGSVKDRESLIFTVPEYMHRYTSSKTQDFRGFLKRIFNEYTVLFIGYGVSEFEILEFLLRGMRKDKQHYMLTGFYSGENNILDFEQTYYKEFKIEIVAFEKDSKGYFQLEEVIRSWIKEIEQVTKYLPLSIRSIDKAIQTPSKELIIETLQRIRNKKSLENYFFDTLVKSPNSLIWLEALLEERYFIIENSNFKNYNLALRWNIFKTLEHMAVENEKSHIQKYSKIMLKIVRNIILSLDNQKGENNERSYWLVIKTISHFSIDNIYKKHIGLIKSALQVKAASTLIADAIYKDLLPKLIKEDAKGLIIDLLKIILQFRTTKTKHFHQIDSIIDPYHLNKILTVNKGEISRICAIDSANVALAIIQKILTKFQFQFNYVHNLHQAEEKQIREQSYENQLINFTSYMLEKSNPDDIEEIVKNLLESSFDINKRLAYYLIDCNYKSLFCLFWAIKYNPLNISPFDELYILFKNRSKHFTQGQLQTILDWIESQEKYINAPPSDYDEREKQFDAYQKKKWLHALLDTENNEIKKRYKFYNNINISPIELHEASEATKGLGTIKEVSPIGDDDYKKMTNNEIATFIKSYKEEFKNLLRDDLTRENLASSLRKYVSNDPIRYSSDLTPFLSISPKYQYEILRGFEEAWKNNKDLKWDELISFMKKIIKSKTFWLEEKEVVEFDYNSWIVSEIADIIIAGTKNDEHAFSVDLLSSVEEIILILLRNVNSSYLNDSLDFITAVLNSSKGRVFISAIDYSLRCARTIKNDLKEKWIISIKDEFTKCLDKSYELNLGFSVILGLYLPNLNYLDKQWVQNNFNRIFDLGNDEYWEAAFSGYIIGHSTVYEDIYKSFREFGHYKKGLMHNFKDKQALRNLVQNIAIAYLAGWEKLSNNDSLICMLIKSQNPEHLSELIKFIWSLRKNENKPQNEKIKLLWKDILSEISPLLEIDDQYCKIASDLSLWLSLIDEIDNDIFTWLSISAKYFTDTWSSGFFIEYLKDHVKKSPKEVGELYLIMLNANHYPDYKEEDIFEIIETLIKSNELDTVQKIYNLYLIKSSPLLIKRFAYIID